VGWTKLLTVPLKEGAVETPFALAVQNNQSLVIFIRGTETGYEWSVGERCHRHHPGRQRTAPTLEPPEGSQVRHVKHVHLLQVCC
jgi:hypothetical protein